MPTLLIVFSFDVSMHQTYSYTYILTPIYRSMTLAEKQQLQSLIQKLPSRNLDRVVELLRRNRPAEEQSYDQIFVDLETEVLIGCI